LLPTKTTLNATNPFSTPTETKKEIEDSALKVYKKLAPTSPRFGPVLKRTKVS